MNRHAHAHAHAAKSTQKKNGGGGGGYVLGAGFGSYDPKTKSKKQRRMTPKFLFFLAVMMLLVCSFVFFSGVSTPLNRGMAAPTSSASSMNREDMAIQPQIRRDTSSGRLSSHSKTVAAGLTSLKKKAVPEMRMKTTSTNTVIDEVKDIIESASTNRDTAEVEVKDGNVIRSVKTTRPVAVTEPTTTSKKPEGTGTNKFPRRKWAYAFMLGGIPTINDPAKRQHAGYRGLLYNIMVSISILRDSGSTADMILMVHFHESYAELPLEDAMALQKMNVIVKYLPPTSTGNAHDGTNNGLSTIPLEKFRILDFLEYSRVFYLEADIMPNCNLDYLLELSEPETSTIATARSMEGIEQQPPLRLQENVILSIAESPSSSSFFILRPMRGRYHDFLNIFSEYPDKFAYFNQTTGWGHKMTGKDGDFWVTVKSLQSKTPKPLKKWGFPGNDNDDGLLYYYTRFLEKKVSIIARDRVYTVTGEGGVGDNTVTEIGNNPLNQYSCLTDEEEHTGGIGAQWYADKVSRGLFSPFGMAPYRDFTQWEHHDFRPWNYPQAPHPSLPITSARRRWYSVLRQLDQTYELGLDLYDPNMAAIATNAAAAQDGLPGEGVNEEEANWNYSFKKELPKILPLWSTKVHALKQWGTQQMKRKAVVIHYQPPLLLMQDLQGPHRQHLLGDPNNSQEQETTAGTAPQLCNCSTPLEYDPCSIPNQPKIEDWMKPRLGMGFSKQRPACPLAARHRMHIILPFANLDVETARAAYCSVQCQNYPTSHVSIYLYEDGASPSTPGEAPQPNVLETLCGTDGVFDLKLPMSSSEVAAFDKSDEEFDILAQNWANETMISYMKTVQVQKDTNAIGNTICIHSKEHSGPGGAKYYAFRLVQAHAEANDVVVVVDGDDELNTPKALEVINRKYVDQSAWMTYGSYAGKYSEQTKAIPRSIQTGNTKFDPRNEQPDWRFGHTRSFKAHLLKYLGRMDFSFEDKTWLVKATDRGFVYRLLELSGVDRVAYISHALYKYKWSASASTVAQVPKDIRVAQLDHVKSLPPSERIRLPFHIVIVCWSRVYLLGEQLVWLQEQTLAKDRQLIVHLLSNNAETHPEVAKAVDIFWEQNKSGNHFVDCVPLKINVVKNERNWHAFSRFLYVRELRRTVPLDTVFFVDDDQYWLPNFLESLLTYHKPKGMTTWYGKSFSNIDPTTGLVDYWTSDIKWTDIATKRLTEVTTFTYGGPGGSVYDGNLWLFDQQLLRLGDDLERYYEFDDVWASFCIDALLGWEHRRIPFPIPVDIANCDKKEYDIYIYRNTPFGVKDKLLQMNKAMKTKMLAVATFSSGARGSKTDMFGDLQRHFRWDISRPSDSPRLNTKEEVAASSQIGVPPARMLSHTKATAESQTKRAFVCVTGQFERLSLSSKIENFFVPMINDGYEVDVALVLSAGETSFTNKGFGKLADLKPKDMDPFYTKLEDAVTDLQAAKVGIISPTSADEGGLYDKLVDPKIHKQYLIHLYEAQTFMRTFDEQSSRAENHPRIYESYHRCLHYAEERIQKAADAQLALSPNIDDRLLPKLETYYDVYFRMRDDVGFQSSLPDPVLQSLIQPPSNSITVTGCRSWGGMNDRFAAVSPDVAHTYFRRPYEIFATNEELKDNIVNNPESFLLYSYLTAGIDVFAHRQFKGVMRFFTDPAAKKEKIYGDDLARDWCLLKGKMNHTDHLISLYGWNFGQ